MIYFVNNYFICPSIHNILLLLDTAEESTSLWLGPLKRIVDLPSWNFQSDEADFNLRANVLDQLISIFTQSKTILGNDGDELVMSPIVAR